MMMSSQVLMRVAFLISACLLSASITSAQGDYRFRSRELLVSKESFVLALNGLRQDADWVVGVSPRPGPTLVAVDVHGRKTATRPAFAPTGFEELPDQNVGLSAGSATLNHLSELKGKLLVYLQIPTGTRFELIVGGESVTRVAVGQGFLIRQGRLVSAPVDSPARVFSELLSPPGIGPPNFVPQKDGSFLVSNETLRSHLIEFSRPKLALPQQVRSGTAMVRILIDPEGRIVSAAPLGRNSLLSDACVQAVRSWRFRPVTLRGKAVPVTATLVFKIADNQILSSLLD